MPTSSIFADFSIEEPDTAEAFVNTIEASERNSNQIPVKSVETATVETIQNLLSRRRQNSKDAEKKETEVSGESGPIHFHVDNLEIEKIYVPTNTRWFHVEMLDPATPSFCTFEKSYFGTEEMIAAFREKRNGENFDLVSCELIHSQRLIFGQAKWEHINVWDYVRNLRADAVTMDQVLLYNDGWYYLCICPTFHSLAYYSTHRREWVRVSDRFWGQKGLVGRIGNDYKYNLYVLQKAFQSLEDARETMDNPALIRFDTACDEIFGDG